MPDDATTTLFQRLNRRHPLYETWQTSWEMARDVMGEVEIEKERYLPRNKLEPPDQYAFRVRLSHFIPESPLSVIRILGALYKEKPKREMKDEGLQTFIDDVDLQGQGINSFMEKALFQLLSYGSTRILLNVTEPVLLQTESEGEQVQLTRAEEIAQGVRPYAVPYTPLSVIDWDTDPFGKLTMIRIKEIRNRKENPFDPLSPHTRVVRFIHYDRMQAVWWEFVGEDGREELDAGRSGVRIHGLGMVPMVVCYWPQRLKPMIGASYIRHMAKADIQRFQAQSDLAYDLYLHAHPTLKVWTNEEMEEVGVGSGSFLKLKPGSQGMEREDANYVEAPTSAFDALRDYSQDKLETIDRHASTDPLGQMSSGASTVFQASGVARAWSFGTSEARILSDVADAAVLIERAMYDLATRLQTPEDLPLDTNVFKGEVQYPEEFDLSSTSQLIEESQMIAQMINSETLIKTLHKRIAASKVGDTTPATLKKIQQEINTNPLINTSVGKKLDPFGMPALSGGGPDGPPPDRQDNLTDSDERDQSRALRAR